MSKQKPRVCIIGAGPSGMSAVYQIKLLAADSIDFECYEKQKTWGGQWNFTWRTGRMTRGKCGDLSNTVHFQHVVSSVSYRDETDDFEVWVRDLPGNKTFKEQFSHVIVATGSFTYPNMPDYPGIGSFPGRILHSHDFREAKEFVNKTVLIIGGRFSAGEIAIQLNKYGAKHVVVSCKERMNLQWPKGVEERPIVEEIKSSGVVSFKDNSEHAFDAIIYCTGYRYNYPFLQGCLHFDIEGKTNLYPDGLYKGTVWMKGGNYKLFHMSAYEAYFNFGLFDAQAIWIIKYILDKFPQASRLEMEQNVKDWQEKLKTVKVPVDHITFQRDFFYDLAKDIGCPLEYVDEANEILKQAVTGWPVNTCRNKDRSYKSMYTGKMAPKHHTPWFECMDDSVEAYI